MSIVARIRRVFPIVRSRLPRLTSLSSQRIFSQETSRGLYNGALGKFLLRERQFGHQTYSIANVCGHTSFLILAISFICSDVLHLRIIALFAGMFMATFNFFHPNGRTLWLPFRWNILFILINSFWIGKLLKELYDASNLKKYEMWLYEEVFALTEMRKTDFLKLVRIGELKIYSKGEHLTTQGEKSHYVQVLIEGSAHASVHGKNVYHVTPGNFISELGIHSGLRSRSQSSSASIVADDMCISISWKRGALIDILETNTNIAACFQAAITADLIKKMNRSNLESQKSNDDWYGNMDYKQIVGNILKEGIKKRDRAMLARYRRIHFISNEDHRNILNSLGWSEDDFQRGWQEANAPALHAKEPEQEVENAAHDDNLSSRVSQFLSKYGLDDAETALYLHEGPN